MILYLLIAIIIIIIACVAYIRLKFKFWADQPVMHIYDIKYWFKNKGIIDHLLPEKNKYCNFKSIEMREFSTVSEIKLTEFINLIQNNYLRNKDNVFLPLKQNIVPYFVGHNTLSFWSFYWEDTLVQRIKDDAIVKDKKLLGVITSRPLNIIIYNGNKDARFQAYYVDYLCVHKLHRKKGIAPQLIQTHEYNQRYANKSIAISLFKREDELTGIIPLCIFNTYAFSMKNWNKPFELSADITLVRCGKVNLHHLFPLLSYGKEKTESTNALFDIIILPEIGNIMELIKTDNIFVYMLVQNDIIIGAYFFRKSCTFIKKDQEALSCFASIYDFRTGLKDEFIHGYKMALSQICAMPGATFHYAVIEAISSNDIIVNNLMKKTIPCIVSPTAYFFYNFAYSTFNANKVLVIN